MDRIDKLKEFKWLILSFFILALAILFFILAGQEDKNSLPSEVNTLDELLSTEETESMDNKNDEGEEIGKDISFVLVDVKGAVTRPGVYQLDGKSRVVDAINIAGGLTDEAFTKDVNFAKHLVDEMMIYIPVEGEIITDITLDVDNDMETNRININTANLGELETLTGIGPQKAQEIIRYRETEGNFKTIEELTNVSGIGDKTFEKLKDNIMVD